MFFIDDKCSAPFHIVNVDLIDCYGGSAELIRVFNRLGICTSLEILQRHIQSTVIKVESMGLLQGLNPLYSL